MNNSVRREGEPVLFTAPYSTYPWLVYVATFRAGAARLEIPKNLTVEDVADLREWLLFVAERAPRTIAATRLRDALSERTQKPTGGDVAEPLT